MKKLETHKYAPELNRVYFSKGGSISCPGITDIKTVKEKYFFQVPYFRLFAVVRVKNSVSSANYSGFVCNRSDLRDTISKIKTRHTIPGEITEYRISLKSIFTQFKPAE